MDLVYVLVAVAALIGLLFLFGRKKPAEPLPPAPEERKLSEARPTTAVRPKKDEAVPSAAAAKAATALPEGEELTPESTRALASDATPDITEEEPRPSQEVLRPSLAHVRDVESLRRGLSKARSEEGFFGRLKALIGGRREISPDLVEQIEEVLLTSDVGVSTTASILERVRDGLRKGDLTDEAKVWDALRAEAKRILSVDGTAGAFLLRDKPTVVVMVGVNGAGKTTTIGKLATKLQANGSRCLLAAGDTFRAAAVQQLVIWGTRVGCEVIKGKDGSDPGSVIFDAVKRARETEVDVLLADTAGRLHTKTNLMAEMKKIVASAGKALPGAPHEVLLVIDATNGQNALAQAKEFKDTLPLTGIVLTKLDGTAKGGIVLGICDTLKLPVRFIGLGERANDLHEFSPDDFVEALLGRDGTTNAS